MNNTLSLSRRGRDFFGLRESELNGFADVPDDDQPLKKQRNAFGELKAVTGADVHRLARQAAFAALEAAGCLAKQREADRLAMHRAANAAQRRHDEWKRQTSNAF